MPVELPPSLTRRSALLSLASTALATPFAGSALAQQAEWSQNYDGVSNLRVQRNTAPLLSPQTVQATEQAVEQYRQLAATGLVQVPGGQYRVGSRGAGVTALRQRLAQTGDLSPEGASSGSDVYDSFVEAGVRRIQHRHGINPTGVVDSLTSRAINVPAQTRVRQLEVNLVRLRTLASSVPSSRYITTNIPAAQIETVENGVVQTHHQAVVGKPDRQSPVLSTKIPEINFHPFWTTPASIVRKDLIPKMRTEPNYLTENHIRIFNGQGQEVPSTSINWNSDDALKFRFRQDPGDFNSMGTVRINVPSPHGVYMHDTNSKGLFGDNARFHSSGCIRVQNVRDYVAWILKNTPGMTRDKVEELFRGGQRVDVKIADPVQLYWVYVTAWGTPDGVTQFREDIYNKDGLGAVPVAALQGVTAND